MMPPTNMAKHPVTILHEKLGWEDIFTSFLLFELEMDLAAAETLLFHTRWFLSQMLLFQLIYLGYRLLHPPKSIENRCCRRCACAVPHEAVRSCKFRHHPPPVANRSCRCWLCLGKKPPKSLNLLAEPDYWKWCWITINSGTSQYKSMAAWVPLVTVMFAGNETFTFPTCDSATFLDA